MVPGTKHWRRSLTVDWRAHFGRISWDLHSALGFWCFIFVLVWGISGIYLVFPEPFNTLLILDPGDRSIDPGLFWLTALHFGRFGRFVESIWVGLGLVPAMIGYSMHLLRFRRYGRTRKAPLKACLRTSL
jgi:uncharacterized iron-regulated membrane protein